jgi:hypothetical protein
MKRIVFFLAAVLVCRSSHAEMLLAEFEFTQPGTVTLPAQYQFTVENANLPGHDHFSVATVVWHDTIEAFPTVQAASPELVDRFNAITTNHPDNSRRVFIYNEPFGLPLFSTRPFDNIWFEDLDPGDGWRAQAFVPFVPNPDGDPERRNGNGLWGYWVTGLERTITAESQLVRIFGHPIPEPAAWLLVLCCAVIHSRKR